ncbi:hypothetical protein AAC387_Pa02g1691 [Persea americana]
MGLSSTVKMGLWIGFLRLLKTKSFLISRNVNRNSDCVFLPFYLELSGPFVAPMSFFYAGWTNVQKG